MSSVQCVLPFLLLRYRLVKGQNIKRLALERLSRQAGVSLIIWRVLVKRKHSEGQRTVLYN